MPRKNATRPSPAQLKTDAMVAELKAADSADPIARFLVMSFDYAETGSYLRTRVYLVPAHTAFPGFGGSRSGLVTGKTPSMIMRQTAAWGSRDTEYDLSCPKAWGYINWLAAKAMAQGTFHIIGTRELIGE